MGENEGRAEAAAGERWARSVGWITFALFAGSIWYGVSSVSPPAPVDPSAAPEEFSSARAMRHIEVIAAEPHPVGSPANARVREYLTAELAQLGFEVELQEAPHAASGPLRPEPETPTLPLTNIVARLPGRRTGPALVLA